MFKKIISESRRIVEAEGRTAEVPMAHLKAVTGTFGSDDSKRAGIVARAIRKKGSTVSGVTQLPPKVMNAKTGSNMPAPPPQAFKRKASTPPPIPADSMLPARKPFPSR